MASAQALANTVLQMAFENSVPITPMKLQKLVYFIYKDYLKTTNTPLFDERFMVWRYGPVLQSVYNEFKGFKGDRITKFAKDANNTVFVVSEKNNKAAWRSIHKVWNNYHNMSGVQLSELTHHSDSSWALALARKENFLNDKEIKNAKY